MLIIEGMVASLIVLRKFVGEIQAMIDNGLSPGECLNFLSAKQYTKTFGISHTR